MKEKLLNILVRIKLIKSYRRIAVVLREPGLSWLSQVFHIVRLAYYAARNWVVVTNTSWADTPQTRPDNGNRVIQYAFFIDTPGYEIVWFWQ